MNMARNPEVQRLLAALNGTNYQEQPNSADHYSQPEVNHGHKTTYNNIASAYVQSSNKFTTLPGLDLKHKGGDDVSVAKTVDPRRRPASTQPTHLQPRGNDDRSRSISPIPQDMPDASGITTWSAALKHVTKHLVPNEKVSSRISHLITEQHKHERQWWAQRQAIVARHEGRVGNQAKAAELLKAIGGLSVPIIASDPKANQLELQEFDKKVYKSLRQMVADFDGQLRKMGVPFFAIRHELVILEDGREKEGAIKGRLDKGELRELQKRMVETLEDLFGEDESQN